MTTPTQRSLAYVRNEGAIAHIVEKWNSHARIRQDMFGFIDIVAVEPGEIGCLGIQSTSGPNVSARRAKIEECEKRSDALERWLRAGNRFRVEGWRKVKLKRGGKATRWRPRILYAVMDDDNEIVWKEQE